MSCITGKEIDDVSMDMFSILGFAEFNSMNLFHIYSPLLLRSFEQSGPMTLCACPHVLVVLCCTACAW